MELGQMRLLAIEDNPGDLALIREMLCGDQTSRVTLESAESLVEGLQRLADGGIDLVLLDLGLPDSSGLDTLTRAQAHAADVPIIVLTGSDDEAVGASAVCSGAQDYLVKGRVDRGLLVRSICYAIARHRLMTASKDPLLTDLVTGLYNRRAFFTLAQRELKLALRRNEDLLLLVLRVGGLKNLFGASGILESERALANVARIVRETMRESDLIARTGVEDFAILAVGAPPQTAETLIARLRRNLAAYSTHKLSFSIGTATPSLGGDVAVDELVAKARMVPLLAS